MRSSRAPSPIPTCARRRSATSAPPAETISWGSSTVEADVDLKVEAIRALGAAGGHAGTTLQEIYRGTADERVKHAVIDALFVDEDARTMIVLARGEKDRELRRSMLQKLSMMDSPDALEFLSKQLDN